MLSITPSEIPLTKLHQYLLGAVGPRPIALASTLDEQGRNNLAPFSFFNVFSVNPPIAIFSPARRGSDNSTKHTYENVKHLKECVINIVNFDMVQQMSLCSADYAAGVDEFVKSGLTPIASEVVKPQRVQESPIQMECIVKQILELGKEGGAGNLIVCEIVRIHIKETILNEDGSISPVKMDQVARMGGHWYSRANMGLFQLAQPTVVGIGVDNMPRDIRMSKVLTGNNIGQLAGVTQLPDETTVNEYKLTALAELFIELENDPNLLEQELHKRAKQHLEQNNIEAAWLTLLAYND